MFTAGIQSVRAVAVLASFSFSRSPVTTEDEIERIHNPMPIVDADEEVGVILVFDLVDRVGNREAEILVLGVAQHLAQGRKPGPDQFARAPEQRIAVNTNRVPVSVPAA